MQATSLRARIEELSVDDPSILHSPDGPRSSDVIPSPAIVRDQHGGGRRANRDVGMHPEGHRPQAWLNFPYDAGDDIVFLCWQFGESRVVAWHSVGQWILGASAAARARPDRYLN